MFFQYDFVVKTLAPFLTVTDAVRLVAISRNDSWLWYSAPGRKHIFKVLNLLEHERFQILTCHWKRRITRNVVLWAFRLAALSGDLHALRFLTETFHLLPEDARTQDNDAFRMAAQNGHLCVLKFLTKTFHLTQEDARSQDNQAFRFAATNGHLSVLRFLTDTFHLTQEDAQDH